MLTDTRARFDAMLNAVRHSSIMAFDTEATGKFMRHGDRVVGISLYTNYNDGETWYIPIAHGYKDNLPTAVQWADVPRFNAKGKALKPKKPTAVQRIAWGAWLYQEHLQPAVQAANIPQGWLSELIAIWLMPKFHVAHNAPFDLTALETLGFPVPTGLQDTMSMVSVANPDWRGNPREGIITQFFMPDTQTYEQGRRSLKWLARQFGLTDATAGIDSLESAVHRLSQSVVALGGGVPLFAKPKPKPRKKKGEVMVDMLTGEEEAADDVTEDAPDGDELTTAAQAYIWMLHPAEVALYAEEDTRLTYELWRKTLKWIKDWDEIHLAKLYNKITLAMWRIERQGFRLDTDLADSMIEIGERLLEAEVAKVNEMSGGWITKPASAKQVKGYLNAIGVEVVTTGKDDLNLVSGVPIIQPILTARTLAIRLHTYIQKWRSAAITGHVHPTIVVGGAGTGRASSASEKFGNLQNIPSMDARMQLNPKRLLCAPKGMILVEIDYSTLEMRIAAWEAETRIGGGADLTLTNLILNGEDMHAYTMRVSGIYDMLLNGQTEEEYLRSNGYDLNEIKDPKQYFYDKVARRKAKTTNFAAIYGAGWRGIMKAVGCSRAEADVLLAGYRRAYPAVVDAMGILEREALLPRPYREGSDDLFQFIRYPIPALNLTRKYSWYPTHAVNKFGRPFSPIKAATRGAFNSKIQGTGALIMLDSIVRVLDKYGCVDYVLDKRGERVYSYETGIIAPLDTVHDAFLMGLRPEDLWIVPDICVMMCAYPVHPALAVDVSASGLGGAWGDTKRVVDMQKWINSGGAILS